MYCGNCGKSFKEDNKFCPYCGAVNDFIETKDVVKAPVIEQADEQQAQLEKIAQPQPKKKMKKWKKIVIAVACVVAVALIGTLSYYATCFFTGKAYRVERDNEGGRTEYYFGESLGDSVKISYDADDKIQYEYTREKKRIDDEMHLIETQVHFFYDENGKLSYKYATVDGEPGIYQHTYTVDAGDNYTSDEKWYPGDKEGEYIIKDAVLEIEIKRYYEQYDIDDADYLVNSSKLCLLRGGGLKTDGSSHFFVTRLVKEDYTDEKEPNNSYTSTIAYNDKKIVEKQEYVNGRVCTIEYDLTGEEMYSQWE